ncbi:MAG TPA: hypothetical protein VJR06_04370, partial [Nitrososphaerales archaeon]|nr:hypothetical protein [Nitrososphaerales archaeon]
KMELLVRYTRRPKIPVQSGDRAYDMKTATVAARYLKMNEAVYINIDATVIPAYRDRGVRYGFLGREVLLLPGGVSMASISGAAIHMVLTFRGPDWRHQKVVVSPPFSSKDVRGTMAALLQMLDEAIRRDPSSWEMWDLIPEEGTVFPEMPEGGAAA